MSLQELPIRRLGELADPRQGEVNETSSKRYISKIPNGSEPLLRGASISLYCVRQASQGEILYLDRQAFLRDARQDSKAFDCRSRRLGFQRSAPQNNFRRVIACIIEPGYSCLDTVSYVTEESSALDLDFLVALLNSEIIDWYFRLSSSGSKINNYQFNLFPCPNVTESIGLSWQNIAESQKWEDLSNCLISAIARPGEISSDIVNAMSYCSKLIATFESQKIITRRAERSILSKKSQPIQHTIDRIFYRIFNFGQSDENYVRQRRQEML